MGKTVITDALDIRAGINYVGSPYTNCPPNIDGGYRINFKTKVYPEVNIIFLMYNVTGDLYFTVYDTRSMQPSDVVWKKVTAV